MISLSELKPLENRMVIDEEWRHMEHSAEEPQEEKESGYTDPTTGTFVSDENAFDYALERCLKGTLDDQSEFREMLLDWFYDTWIRVDL